MSNEKTLRILVFREDEMFIAQCLEFDICAQGVTFDEAIRRMDALLEVERQGTLETSGSEYGGLDSAPPHFHKMWDDADRRDAIRGGHEVALAA